MSRVLVAGAWIGGEPAAPSALAALDAVAEGFTRARPGWEAELLPFGPGRALVEALAQAPAHVFAPVVVGIEEASTRRAGLEARRILDAGLVPVIEGGHSIDVDAGLGFLSGFTGLDLEAGVGLGELLPRAIDEGRAILAGRDLIAAASTMRPLLGLASVLALTVGLDARDDQDRALTALLTRVLAAPARSSLPILGADGTPAESAGPGRLAGSGAAGGAAAMIAAIGGRLLATGDFLLAVEEADARLEGADLLILLQARLHSPELAESPITALSERAARFALPVVALGVESSLSGRERAEWGMHGQFLTGGSIRLEEAGARIARTWAR